MTVKLDKVQDASVRQGINSIEVTRVGRITGITGPKEVRPRLALEASGMPRFGDRHPAWGELRVVEIVLQPNDTQQWGVTIVYREPSPEELARMEPIGAVIDRSWFSTTVAEEKLFDTRGNRMSHFYIGHPSAPEIVGRTVRIKEARTTRVVIKNDSATVQRPSSGVRVLVVEDQSVERRLPISSHVNNSRWSGYPPKTWLLSGLESDLDRGRWMNVYTFLYNEATWRFKSTVDYFGAPPSDATEGNGIKFYDVYPTANFNALGFVL